MPHRDLQRARRAPLARPSSAAHSLLLALGLLCCAWGPPLGAEQSPIDLSAQVSALSSSPRCTLDRRTRFQTCTADLVLANNSQSRVLAPVHLVFLTQGSGVQMPGASGGPGVGPYSGFYYDLSASLSNADLAPGETLSVKARFQSPTPVSFQTRVYGVLPGPNQAPTARASADPTEVTLQSGQTLATVALDGSASSDPEGSALAYVWTGTPDPADQAAPEVQLPAGTHAFNLVVSDSEGLASPPATVQVVVHPAPLARPLANAGADRVLDLYGGEDAVSLTLDGTGSMGLGGPLVAYRWEGTPDPADTARPGIALGAGVHNFSLVVTDTNGTQSVADSVSVTVVPLGDQAPPIIEAPAGPLQVDEGATLEFMVRAHDPEGGPVSLGASLDLPGASFSATAGVAASGRLVFAPDFTQAGRYSLVFVARDALGLASARTVEVEVLDLNRAPSLGVAGRYSVDEGGRLAFAVAASDPDGDPVAVTVSPLFPNAIFVPGSRTLVVAPGFDQSGTYALTFEGSDGALPSAPRSVEIQVNDVPLGQVGGARQLDLVVDPVLSPTLGARARVTGTVNAPSTAPLVPKAVSSLIVGLDAASGRQGETRSVTIAGDQGAYATVFDPLQSVADFGEGIEVLSLTVTSAHQAAAQIAIAADAALGPRAVTVRTGADLSVSVVAFDVTPGVTSVRGRLIDPDTGQPIVGARVSIQGTGLSTTTGADGSFAIAGAPAGDRQLVVNPPNHLPLVIPLTVGPNLTVDIGTLGSEATVFDPTSPPSATVPSIIGRGLDSTSGRLGYEAARQLIIDTYLAVGGSEAGVLDASGNQLNPKVSGNGLVTLPDELVGYTAELMVRGESATLGEVLYGLAFVGRWQQGAPPTLVQLLAMLQGAVDRAWADPRAPGSAVVLAIFNRGTSLSPSPPLLTPDSKLSALQRQLLVNSFLAYAQLVVDANPELAEAPPESAPATLASFRDWLLGALIPSAQADAPVLTIPPNQDLYTSYWNGATQFSNIPAGLLATGVREAFRVPLSRIMPCFVTKLDVNGAASGMILGVATQLLTNVAVDMILRVIQPQAPLVIKADTLTFETQVNGANQPWDIVGVEISRAHGDKGTANPPGLHFIYRLWRWDVVGGALELVTGGEPANAQAAAGEAQPDPSIRIKQGNNQVLALFDFAPKPGHNVYKVDVVRTVGDQTAVTGPNLASGWPWWTNLLPQPSFSALGGRFSFSPVGAFMALMDPLIQIANGIKLMVSPLSDNVAAFTGERHGGADGADGFVIDPSGLYAFESVRGDSAIYKIDLKTLERGFFVNPGFAAPYQSGLAIDGAGYLYTENSAGDDSYGGKIFRYVGADLLAQALDPGRTHVGMTSYYSYLLGYARPTSVPAMIMSRDGELFVADAIEQVIKKVPVNASYDPFRRVGQPYAASPDFQFGPGLDLARAWDNGLYVAQPALANLLYVHPGSRTVERLFPDGAGLFEHPRSLDLDRDRTLYVADEGANPDGGGSIKAFPAWFQSPNQAFDACLKDRFTLLEGLANLSFVRLGPLDRRLYYRENGIVKQTSLGFTGQVKDASGQPVAGAEVRVSKDGALAPLVLRTNACGTFRALGLASDNVSPMTQIEVSHPQIGSQVYQGWFGPSGHSFRDFVLSPPVPPPAPADTDPADTIDPPVVVPPLPPPQVVTVVAGSRSPIHWWSKA
jgi:hypothetical protein